MLGLILSHLTNINVFDGSKLFTYVNIIKIKGVVKSISIIIYICCF